MRLQGGKRSFNETEGKELGFIYIFKKHPDEMLVFQSTLAQPIASSVHCLHAKKGKLVLDRCCFIDFIWALGNLTAEVQIICTSIYINKNFHC